MAKQDHLAKAKGYLKIAEAADSKREAYKAAANEIAAHKDATGATNVDVATSLGKADHYVRALLKWRATGFKADSPWLSDPEATTRAAKSHTRTTLADPKRMKEVVESMPDEHVERLANAALKEADRRTIAKTTKTKAPTAGDKVSDLMAGFQKLRATSEMLLDLLREYGRDDIPEGSRHGLATRARRAQAAISLLADYLEGDDVIDEIEGFLTEEVGV